MSEALPRSSADLRAELAALDLNLERLDGRRVSCDVQVQGLALLAHRGDAGAVKKIGECRSAKAAIACEAELTLAARTALTVELRAAIEREAAEATREALSAEALAFAQMVEPIEGHWTDDNPASRGATRAGAAAAGREAGRRADVEVVRRRSSGAGRRADEESPEDDAGQGNIDGGAGPALLGGASR
jgi:hypothetical protein